MKPLVRGITAAVLIAVSAAGGCVPQTDIPIVSEKTGETLETGETLWEDTENDPVPNTVRTQAQVPEVYRTDIQSGDITITADVNVEMPETDRIPKLEIEYLPYTDEELEKMKEILGRELGIDEWQEKPGDESGTYESPDHIYTLSLGAGSGQGQDTPMVWLVCPGISDGSSQAGGPDELSLSPEEEEERKRIRADAEEKAENLLGKMGLEDFCLEEARWRPLAVIQNHSWSPSGEQGIRLYYRRRAQDMPVISREYRTQYVELLYREDTTLLEVKNIGREQVTGTSGYAEIFMPFLSVSQVFEQCMKTAQADGHGADIDPVLEEVRPGIKPHIYLTVTEVRLAYRVEYEGRGPAEPQAGGRKGKLVPVWVFYGITERGYQDINGAEAKIPRTPLSGGKIQLLAVSAEDGTVYWR